MVANQLARLGGYHWRDEDDAAAEPVGDGGRDGLAYQGAAGHLRRRPRRLSPLSQRRAGHRPALRAVADGHARRPRATGGWPPGAHLHVALDDDGARGTSCSQGRAIGRRTTTRVVEGGYEATQRVGERVWRVPVTAFWQAHRDAARVYSELVAEWAQLGDGMMAWDLYGGAGVFAAVLGEAVGDSGQVVDRGHVARRVAVGAGRAGRSGQCVGGHRLGAPGACGPVPARRRRGARPAAVRGRAVR